MARRRRRSRRNHGRKLVLAVLALLLAGLYPLKEQLLEDGGSSQGAGNAAAEDVSAAASGVFRDGSTLEVHFLDVGQGDASLIVCGDDAMLIDAGNNSWGDDVLDYLEYQGVEKLDYVIGHPPGRGSYRRSGCGDEGPELRHGHHAGLREGYEDL